MILGGTLAVVWGIIGVVVYRNFFASNYVPPAPVALGTPTIPIGTTEVPVTIPESLGLEIFRDSRLINLKLFGEVPLEVKALGRTNPFSLINP